MARSYLPGAGSEFAAGTGGPPSARGTGSTSFSRCAGHSDIGLQHRSFTSLSPNGPSSEKASDADFDCAWGEKMRIGTEEVGPSQGCRLGHGLRRVSLWAGESGVSRLGLQYAVTHDPFRRALRHRKLPRMGAPEESVVAHLRRASHLIDWHF